MHGATIKKKLFPVSTYCEAWWLQNGLGAVEKGKNLKPIHEIVERLPGR